MLFGILGMAALGALGYNAVKDEESRTKTKSIVAKAVDALEKEASRMYKNGETSDEFNENYSKFDSAYKNDNSKLKQWQIDAEMLKFKQKTGYLEDSFEYQQKLEELQHKYYYN